MHLAYSADPQARINLGIRRRLAPLMGNNRRRIELLNSLLFSFPGTPIVYYGDEIGMGDNVYLGDRNGVRTPMQWTSDRNARFSRADPAAPVQPGHHGSHLRISGGQRRGTGARRLVVAAVDEEPHRAAQLFTVFGLGTIGFWSRNRKVLAYFANRTTRFSVSPTCPDPCSRWSWISAHLPDSSDRMLGYTEFPIIGTLAYFLTLGPYGFYWLELQRRAR